MTRDEYERSKQRLAEQRRAGVELVETAYQAQVRALDLIWMLQGEGAGGPPAALFSPTPAAPAPAQPEPLSPDSPQPRSAPEVDDDVRAALSRLPERFTRRDVCEALGYPPERGALYRALRQLVQEALLEVETLGIGRRATIYRKPTPSPAPP